MLHLCVFDTHALRYTELRELLPPEEQARLDHKKSEDYRVSSAVGRLLAARLYREVYGKNAPPIVCSAEGAPSFLGEAVALSISHSENLVAVVLSDTHTHVGIDVECVDAAARLEKEREDKLRERLHIPTVEAANPLPPYSPATFRDGAIVFSPITQDASCITRDYAFLRDYTALEALMKADGRGFAALCDIEDIYPFYHLSIGMLRDQQNKAFILTIASKRK